MAPHDQVEWVSKRAVLDYWHCPRTYWRRYTRAISDEEAISPTVNLLLRRGLGFEVAVESESPVRVVESAGQPSVAEPVSPHDFWDRVRAGDLIYRPPLLENHDLKLFGVPDGLKGEDGLVLPVEIKWHGEVKESDELELAFYWLLLQPYQGTRALPPRGILTLRSLTEGPYGQTVAIRQETVAITNARLGQVRDLVEAVRRARREGVEPQVCFCFACQRDPEVQRVIAESRHPRLLHGIAAKHAEGLAAIGIADYRELLGADPQAVARTMRAAGFAGAGAWHVRQWQQHARSYEAATPVLFGEPLDLGDAYIVLDAEYDSWGRSVWLVGTCVVRPGHRRRYLALWISDGASQQRALIRLLELFLAQPDLPVVTWSRADLNALRWLGMGYDARVTIEQRHFDLYDYVSKNVRFPTKWLSQKEVERALGITRSSDIGGGLDAMVLYQRYRELKPRSRQAVQLRRTLEAYNREDLQNIPKIVRRLRALSPAR